MHRINPKKLQHSKWTAVIPLNKEKHFLVTDIEFDNEGNVILCQLEAIMTKRFVEIDWRDLQNSNKWKQGWC